MNEFFIVAAIVALSACNKFPVSNSSTGDHSGSDHPASSLMSQTDKAITVGAGGTVSSKNISVLVGPAIVKGQNASITFYVQKAPPFVKTKPAIITCLVFNTKNQLVVGTGANLPNQGSGGTANFVTPDTSLEGGKVTCTITE